MGQGSVDFNANDLNLTDCKHGRAELKGRGGEDEAGVQGDDEEAGQTERARQGGVQRRLGAREARPGQ